MVKPVQHEEKIQPKNQASLRNGGGGKDCGHYLEGSSQNEAKVRHYIVASPDIPTAPQGSNTHQRDVERTRFDHLIGKWGRELDGRQGVRHPVSEV